MDKQIFLFLLVASLLFCWRADKTNNKKMLLIPIIILSLLAGLRSDRIGTDTYGYVYSITHGFPYGYMFPELGFRYISNLIYNATQNYTHVLLFFALVTNLLILIRFWDFRDQCSYSYMSFFYIFAFYINTLNIMRQYVALALVFYASRYLEKKKYWIFLVFLFISVNIHSSSILGLLFIFIYVWDSLSKKQKILLILPLILIGALSVKYTIAFSMEQIINYSNQRNSNVNFTYFYKLIVFALMLYLNKSHFYIKIFRKKSESVPIKIRDKETEIYFGGLLLSALGMFFLFMSRIGLYYLMFEPVFWGRAVKTGKNRDVAFLLSLVYVLYTFYHLFVLDDCFIFPYSIHFI